jgi:collagenase-like PrtC family protease
MPKLSTFCSTQSNIKTAIELGFQHLILEDSKLSVRSFYDDFDVPNFDKIKQLAAYAKKINADIELSFNCDILTHSKHTPLLEQLVNTLKHANILTIRIQDPGLSIFFKQTLPNCELILNTESSNANSESVKYYLKTFTRQVLSNELPHTDIQILFKQVPHLKNNCEIVVQGPLLLQYSPRRFLTGYYQKTGRKSDNIICRKSQAKEYPGRFFTFMDNPHGHFMYSYFDRSLIKMNTQLDALNIPYWIIDGRGRPSQYLEIASQTFLGKHPEKIGLKELEEIAQKKMKPGFFKINNTDRERSKKGALQDNEIELGKIIDMVKEKWLTIEVKRHFNAGDNIDIKTPDGKVFGLNTDKLFTIWGEKIGSTTGISLVKVRWRKGSQVKSKILKRLPKPATL